MARKNDSKVLPTHPLIFTGVKIAIILPQFADFETEQHNLKSTTHLLRIDDWQGAYVLTKFIRLQFGIGSRIPEN